MKAIKKLSALILSGALLLGGSVCASANSSALPFDDLAADAWYTEGIEYVYENGIMSGMGNNKFAPSENLTREQLMQVFFNLGGIGPGAYDGNTGFNDVKMNQWYSRAVTWAKDMKITSGISEKVFGLGQLVTREQLATFILNYVLYAGCDVNTEVTLDTFEDAGKISEWALDGMKFCVANGIIKGKSETTLDPKGYATRAELAQMLSEFLEAGFLYRIDFDDNGADSCTAEFRYVAPGNIIGNLPNAEKDGFMSGGWWFEGQRLKNTSVLNMTDHITVTHLWGNGVIVCFSQNGGECDEFSRLVNKGEPLGELPVATREGYIFEGWLYTNGEESYIVSAETVIETENKYCYLKAQWKTIEVTE